MKKLLGFVVAISLVLGCSLPAFAQEDAPAASPIAAWSHPYLADGYALGLLDNDFAATAATPVTQVQMDGILTIVADRLALLEQPLRSASHAKPLVLDLTRGGVLNALYQELCTYQLPGADQDAVTALSDLGVVKGDGTDLALQRPCTHQEAVVFAARMVLALYDACDAGSRGLLWKATNGENTLYLLGTIHVDRGNIYPFHKRIRDAVHSAQVVSFEIDFNDQKGLADFQILQTYQDGTTLKDHVSKELYDATVTTLAPLGMSEEMVASYKPWVLSSTLNALVTNDTTKATPMAVDLYLNSLAVNNGKTIDAVETYALQAAIFNNLSASYQSAMLQEGLSLYATALAAVNDTTVTAADQAALDAQNTTMDAMLNAWKKGDAAALESVYDKAATLTSTDELSASLFTSRDPGMIEAAARYLEAPGKNTTFLAVGAGHMIDPGGIVSGLRDKGYTVEVVK